MSLFNTNVRRNLVVCLLIVAVNHNTSAAEPAPTAGRADKILILGNSITLHGPSAAIEWTGNHGMAASEPEKDYVHLLLQRFAAENEGRKPQSLVENIADFERGYGTLDIAKRFQKHAEFQADVVILAIGENVPRLATAEDKARFKKAVAELLATLKTERKTQRIFVRSLFWPDPAKDEILSQVCTEANGSFVDLAEVAKDPASRASAERKFNHAGVGGHPGDKGMAGIADAIWKAWKQLPK